LVAVFVLVSFVDSFLFATIIELEKYKNKTIYKTILNDY
jgi:hypothetical protein